MLLLCAVIFGCFVYELAAVKPVWIDVAKGFIPRPEIITNTQMLYTAIGILGEVPSNPATQHACCGPCEGNVYCHSQGVRHWAVHNMWRSAPQGSVAMLHGLGAASMHIESHSRSPAVQTSICSNPALSPFGNNSSTLLLLGVCIHVMLLGCTQVPR